MLLLQCACLGNIFILMNLMEACFMHNYAIDDKCYLMLDEVLFIFTWLYVAICYGCLPGHTYLYTTVVDLAICSYLRWLFSWPYVVYFYQCLCYGCICYGC